MRILIPMAGTGTRFKIAGYKLPKPLIDVKGRPMIIMAVEKLGLKGEYIFACQSDHIDNYCLDTILRCTVPGCQIVPIKEVTQGSACTALLAKALINDNEPLMITDCDHFPEWDAEHFQKMVIEHDEIGWTGVFHNDSDKYSYVKVNKDGHVTDLKEKIVISNTANAGMYFWKRGSDFVKYAEQMIANNHRAPNGEFYVAPVFMEAIKEGKKIGIYPIKTFWEMGTPEDLQYLLTNYENL